MVLFLIFGFFLANPAFAQINANTTGLSTTAQASGYGETALALPVVIGRIIDIVVGLVGIIVFLLYVYAGVIWMTAQGDSGKVGKAKDMIVAATIGMIIVLSAFAITNFTVTQLDQSTDPNYNPSASSGDSTPEPAP